MNHNLCIIFWNIFSHYLVCAYIVCFLLSCASLSGIVPPSCPIYVTCLVKSRICIPLIRLFVLAILLVYHFDALSCLFPIVFLKIVLYLVLVSWFVHLGSSPNSVMMDSCQSFPWWSFLHLELDVSILWTTHSCPWMMDLWRRIRRDIMGLMKLMNCQNQSMWSINWPQNVQL